jgi:hypothetical protein
MKQDSSYSAGPASLRWGLQRLDPGEVEDLPLSRRAELAGDAIVAGKIVRLMNNILNEREITAAVGSALVRDGIQLAERLQQGDAYLTDRRMHLMPRPDSADMVKSIRARGTSDVSGLTKESISLLTCIQRLLNEGRPVDLEDLDARLADSTRDFFRAVHASLVSQLGAFEATSERVDLR